MAWQVFFYNFLPKSNKSGGGKLESTEWAWEAENTCDRITHWTKIFKPLGFFDTAQFVFEDFKIEGSSFCL